MFGSAILEVIIGMALVYLLLSLVCSALSEWVARIFAFRSKNLAEGINKLLKDDKLLKKFWGHHLVSALNRKKKRGPSYMEPFVFAQSLIDSLAEIGRKGEATKPVTEDAGNTFDLQEKARIALSEIEGGINELGDSPVANMLKGIVRSAQMASNSWEETTAKMRTAMENWFDSSMDRVAGWYKRKTQTIILILAAVVCISLNADTIMIANELSQDSALRESLAAVAVAKVKLQLPFGDSTLTYAVGVKDEIKELGIPLGWHLTIDEYSRPENKPTGFCGWFWMIAFKFLGLCLTIFAVSLGAPFWFDILKRVVNLRSTGNAITTKLIKASASSREEGGSGEK